MNKPINYILFKEEPFGSYSSSYYYPKVEGATVNYKLELIYTKKVQVEGETTQTTVQNIFNFFSSRDY